MTSHTSPFIDNGLTNGHDTWAAVSSDPPKLAEAIANLRLAWESDDAELRHWIAETCYRAAELARGSAR